MLLVKKIFSVVVLGMFVSGCVGGARQVLTKVESELTETIALVKHLNDVQARAYLAVPCAIDLGAYHRVLSPDEQRAADVLCGGSGEKPVSVEDIRRARELMNLIDSPDR